jgi:triosephosphate isomerase
MVHRKPVVAANWKMNLCLAEAETLARATESLAKRHAGVETGVFPGFLAAQRVAAILKPVRAVFTGAQNCSAEASGAHTGEVSAVQIADAGLTWVLVGHSERRLAHGETDAVVGRKLAAALAAGLHPMLCIGETLAEREAGRAAEVIARQLEVLRGMATGAVGLDVAYEPVWAIGTGVAATDEQVAAMHADVRRRLDELGFTSSRVLYGGSVSPKNAAALSAVAGVDGFLVGGASLKAETLGPVIEAVAARLPR